MISNKIKKIHIVGIGGCASSAIAQYLASNNVIVTGSERQPRADLQYLTEQNIKIFFGHDKQNLCEDGITPDFVLYSPAVKALDPNNDELAEAQRQNIPTMSWENFIGEYLNNLGKIGITISGSEGKGTTGAILTTLLRGTSYDPMVFLGAKMKVPNGAPTNIYIGSGSAYILEGDEYNRNFYGYHPSVNVTVNFKYEHPETYKDFDDYKQAFATFFSNMNNVNFPQTLILRATDDTADLVTRYEFCKSHKIIWFANEGDEILNSELIKQSEFYTIGDIKSDANGTDFKLTRHKGDSSQKDSYHIPVPPKFLVYNATGAIIAALELGLRSSEIQTKLSTFESMVRRFDITRTNAGGAFITDYGHSPESIQTIIDEVEHIYPGKNKHFVFQPHLFSRTYAFKDEFVNVLSKADKISLIDIYPAREQPAQWENKISSKMIADALINMGKDAYYAGKSKDIYINLKNRINSGEITVFIGAGDMDLYYNQLINEMR